MDGKVEINWQDPGPGTRKKGAHDAFADALRDNPLRWALWKEQVSNSNADNVKTAKVQSFAPAGSFEATCRRVKNGKGDIYVRYVGAP